MERNRERQFEYIDAESFSYEQLSLDLKHNQYAHIEWLLEEFELQFNSISNTPQELKQLKQIAVQIIPYFIKCSYDENEQICQFAEMSLKQIIERFPDLAVHIEEKKKKFNS